LKKSDGCGIISITKRGEKGGCTRKGEATRFLRGRGGVLSTAKNTGGIKRARSGLRLSGNRDFKEKERGGISSGKVYGMEAGNGNLAKKKRGRARLEKKVVRREKLTQIKQGKGDEEETG